MTTGAVAGAPVKMLLAQARLVAMCSVLGQTDAGYPNIKCSVKNILIQSVYVSSTMTWSSGRMRGPEGTRGNILCQCLRKIAGRLRAWKGLEGDLSKIWGWR